MKTINTLDPKPFRRLCMTIGELPSSYLDSMTYYEMVAWLCEYIKKNVVTAINDHAAAIKEIQDWIETLDLQDEVDDKIDRMKESGELAEIITQYLEISGVLGFNDVEDMKGADNLIDGSICRTLGKIEYNDDGGCFYKIRTITSSDVVDEENILSLDNFETLIAEKIDNTSSKTRKGEVRVGDGLDITNGLLSTIADGDYLDIDVIKTRYTGTGGKSDVVYAIIPAENKPKLTLANGVINQVEDPGKNAYENKASILVNAGRFDTSTYDTTGMIVVDSILKRNNDNLISGEEILYMTSDGIINSIASTTSTDDVMALNPVWAVQGWYPFMKDGIDVTSQRDPSDYQPRSIIAQATNGDYLVATFSGREYLNKGVSAVDVMNFIGTLDFTPYFVYNLDGGASVNFSHNGIRQNKLTTFEYRKDANYIVFTKDGARNEAPFLNQYVNNETQISDLKSEVPVDIKAMIVNGAGVTQGATSMAKIINNLVVLNLDITLSSNVSTYAHILENLPPYPTSSQYFFINKVDGTTKKVFINSSGILEAGEPLTSGQYFINITYTTLAGVAN